MVQWLRICAPNTGGLDLTHCQETRPCMPQPRPSTEINKNVLKKLLKKPKGLLKMWVMAVDIHYIEN